MQPISRQQLHRNKYLRATSFEGKADQGDSFRIPKGDRRQPQPQPMASVNDDDAAAAAPGETSPESSFTTVILRTVTKGEQVRVEMDEDCSSCSSPPTHPAFYSPAKAAPVSVTTLANENVCPNTMAAPSSPAVSPRPVRRTRKSPNGLGAGGAVMLDRFIHDGEGIEERRFLGNVDTNVLAARSNEEINGDFEVVSLCPGPLLPRH